MVTAHYGKILAGAISGTCSSAFAVPSDVLKVRMMADNTSDPNKRPKMSKIIRDIIKNDGIFGFIEGQFLQLQERVLGLCRSWHL